MTRTRSRWANTHLSMGRAATRGGGFAPGSGDTSVGGPTVSVIGCVNTNPSSRMTRIRSPARPVLDEDPFILATSPDGLIDRPCVVHQACADRMREDHTGLGGNVGQRMDREVRIAVVQSVSRTSRLLAASTEVPETGHKIALPVPT